MFSAALLAVLAVAPLRFARADSNGMDMSMDGAMDLAEGKMLPYLHFSTGDMLWFLGWVPVTAASMIGACIGLFLLAIVERWIAACRSLMEAHWRKQSQMLAANRMNGRPSSDASSEAGYEVSEKVSAMEGSGSASLSTVRKSKAPVSLRQGLRSAAPFIPSYDITRGIMHAGQAAIGFAFMLCVMTFQVGFILSICAGLGVGEALFGRYAMQAHLH